MCAHVGSLYFNVSPAAVETRGKSGFQYQYGENVNGGSAGALGGCLTTVLSRGRAERGLRPISEALWSGGCDAPGQARPQVCYLSRGTNWEPIRYTLRMGKWTARF